MNHIAKQGLPARAVLMAMLATIPALLSSFASATTYTVTDLGTLGGTKSAAFGVNNFDVCVGYATLSDGAMQPFSWSNGTMTDLGTFGGNTGISLGVNDSGVVAGYASNGSTEEAFEYTNDTLTSLGAATPSFGYSVNGLSELTGEQYAGSNKTSMFLFSGDTLTTLPAYLGFANNAGESINSSGQIAGEATDSAQQSAFLWTPSTTNGTSGTYTTVGTLGGTNSIGLGINDFGEVVGYSETASNSATDAFVWVPNSENGTTGTINDIGTLGGIAEAESINATGVVVGFSVVGTADHAFIWSPTSTNGSSGSMVDLNALLPPSSGWVLQVAHGINNQGDIVGYGTHVISGTAQTRAFLLTMESNPVPVLNSLEPKTVDAGEPGFTLDVTGNDFLSSSTVDWNGSPLVTTPLTSSSLTAAVPASLITTHGTAQITVVNPAPGGGTSNPLAFTITETSISTSVTSMTKDSTTGDYVATLSLTNSGSETAKGTKITKGTLGDQATITTLPLKLGDIKGGGSATATLTFPASAGNPMQHKTISVKGVFQYGTLKFSKSVKLPS